MLLWHQLQFSNAVVSSYLISEWKSESVLFVVEHPREDICPFSVYTAPEQNKKAFCVIRKQEWNQSVTRSQFQAQIYTNLQSGKGNKSLNKSPPDNPQPRLIPKPIHSLIFHRMLTLWSNTSTSSKWVLPFHLIWSMWSMEKRRCATELN